MNAFLMVALAATPAISAGPPAPDLLAPQPDNHNRCSEQHGFSSDVSGVVTAPNRDYWTHTSSWVGHTFTLTPQGGDADLYVWNSNCSGSPLCSSLRFNEEVDSCSTDATGVLKVEVRYFACIGAGCDSVSYSLSQTHRDEFGFCLAGHEPPLHDLVQADCSGSGGLDPLLNLI